jgi:hypothetical protein
MFGCPRNRVNFTALAASQFVCLVQTVSNTKAIAFSYPGTISAFGNSIITQSNSNSFTSITLGQSGFYQIELDVDAIEQLVAPENDDGFYLALNGGPYNLYGTNLENITWTAPLVSDQFGNNTRAFRGSLIINASANTTLQIIWYSGFENIATIGPNPTTPRSFDCKMSITQIH